MKKTTLRQAALKLALVALAMLSPLGLRAQETLTVNDETATNGYIPFYGYYMDTPGNTSEFIIPADQLGDMEGGTISKLTFYLSGSFASWGSPTVQIYLGEVEGTTLSSTYGPTNFTVVYTGTVSNQTNPMVIEFDDPYVYEGGNLLIGTYVQVAGSYKTTNFYGVSATSGSSINSYEGWSGVTTAPQQFLPKTTFEYEPAATGGPTCSKPSTFDVTNITAHGAIFTWENTGAESYTFEYKIASDEDYTVVSGLTNNTYTLSSLAPGTSYNVRVKAVCGTDLESGYRSTSFTTMYGVPLNEAFTASSVPTGWTRYTGLLSEVMAGTALSGTSSGWNFGTSNNVFDSHARVNIYGTSCKYWLVTPALTMEDNVQLMFDMALTAYSGALAAPTTTGTDDKFVVLINDGEQWTILRQWDNDGSEYVYNNIACSATGQSVAIDLSSYAGQSIQIAFYGESTVSNADNNLHIDNVSINYIPSCAVPTALTKSNVTAHTVDLSWTAGNDETAWQICVNNDEDNLIDVTTTNSYQVTGLAGETTYSMKVRANCGDDGYSEWSNPVSFTTDIACTAPTGYAASITSHGATISWTAVEGASYEYQVVPTASYNAETIEWQTTTANEITISDLTSETGYTFALRKNCGSEDGYSQPITRTFTTPAGNIAPTGLAVSDVSNNSATASWTGAATNDLHESYDIYYSQLSTMPEELNQDSLFTGHDEATYTFEDLTPSTGYFVWVRDNCGTDGYSGWVGPVSFTTQAACPAPELNATGITNVTAHTANVEWSNFEANDSYVVSYRSAESINTNGGLYEDFNSLNTANSIPEGWSNDEGSTSTASHKWCYNTATSSNGATNGTSHDGSNCVRFDSYNNSSNNTNFLQTPSMDFPAGETMKLSFWWKNPAAGDFSVYISTDGGTTKNPIAEGLTGQSTWTQATYELTDYVGASNVTIHFKGTSNYGYGDAYIYLDDIMVGYTVPAGEWETEELTENSIELTGLVAETTYEVKVKGLCSGDQENESDIQTFTTAIACPAPTALTAGAATTNSVPLSWTAGAANQDNWQICLNNDEENLLDVVDATIEGTAVTYTLTGLTPATEYTIKVRANCGDEDSVSLQWTNPVTITTEASCTEPTAFAVVENSVEAHQAQLSWTAGGDETAWDIYYFNTNSAPVNGVTEPTIEGVTENNPYTLLGLTDARTYYVWVRAHCGDAAGQQSPWVGPVSFSTPQEAVTAPYADDFENGNNWLLVNGNLTNAWAYGEAVNNGGTHALYISNDGGATNAYNNGSAAMVYATKLITFEEGTYKFSYDWKANGESNYDYLRVALGPATTTLTAGTSVPTDFGTTTLPTGWTALDGGSKLNLKTDWQSYGSAEMPIAAGTYMMVFAWRNDNSQGTNPPAAIDNVSIEKITCIAPTALAASNVTAHAATLGWTAGADEEAWQIAYGTTADFDPDDVTPIDVTENPYLFGNLTQSTHYYAYVRAKCGEDDYSNWSNMTDFTTISGKQMPTGLTVTDIASATATATWTGVTTNVLHESYDLYYSKLSSMPETLNEDSLFTGITATTHDFANLESEVTYYVWVRDNCGTDGKSDWTSTSFITLPSCPTPTALAATNITNNAATISWTGSSDVANYTVQYREAEYLIGIPEEFGSSLPSGWENKTGLLSNIMNGSDFSASTQWVFGSNNGVFDNHARINIYGSPRYGWLITPEVELEDNAVLNFDIALTAYNGTGAASGTCDDDRFVVLVYANDVWNILREWNNSGSDDVYNNIPTAGENVTIDLTDYVGQTVKIAFYGESTVNSNGDNDLHIDNVAIGTAVAAGEWNDATEDVAAESFTIEGLEAETKYDVQVKSNCTNGEYGAPYTFTTASVFTKSIQANKWYAIATPVHDCVKLNDAVALTNVLNLTTAANDLYSYDEANGSWMAASDSLMTGTGYIYRSAADAELGFVGYANTGRVSVSLTSSCSDIDLKGFNLIGNPYPHAVAISQPHYTLNPNGTWTAHTSNNTIGVAEAFLVYSTYSPNTYYFSDVTPSTPSKGNTASAALAFTVSNGEYSDVAYARFDNGEGLPKIGHLAANAPMLSIPVEGRRYAVANVGSDCESFDMVLRGVSGTYTLSFSGNSSYCHLVDRVAGKDIDMLRQNYTFSSNGFDADRFTVKLSPDAQENANGNFAYWNGNVWMVEGNGTLQVFDALGRQLLSQEISNSNFEIQNSLFPAAGVYVLRMGEKTQKIVVR